MGKAIHPLAFRYRKMTDLEFQALCDSIKTEGLKEPIVLHKGKVVDGRNRQDACEAVGVPATYVQWDGAGDLEAYVWAKNGARRHLDASQLALAVAERKFAPNDNMTQKEAAKRAGVSPRSVTFAASVLEKGRPELIEAVRMGEVTVSDAAAVANLPPARQQLALDRVRSGAKRTLKASAPKPKTPQADVQRDQTGNEIPNNLADVFGDLWLAEAKAWITGMIGRIKSSSNPYIVFNEVIASLEEARSGLDSAVPYAVHQACLGKGCDECRKVGWLPHWRVLEIDHDTVV